MKSKKNSWRNKCSLVLIIALLAGGLTGCSGTNMNENLSDTSITVLSREDGSGTRGAFVELFGVEQKNENGEKEDMTTEEAGITNSTSVMMATVSGNKNAIGYISLGALNDHVKAVEIDGVAPSIAAIKDGSYPVSRPFNVVPCVSGSSAATQDFLDFILSAEGQAIVEKTGYIALVEIAPTYVATDVSGKVVVAGSSSVTPVMEKLKEAYMEIQPNVIVDVQMSDSSTGVNYALDGTCDLGMVSRELKSSETEKGAEVITIALDGIAVIVNRENAIDALTTEQVRDIYTGAIIDWKEITL